MLVGGILRVTWNFTQLRLAHRDAPYQLGLANLLKPVWSNEQKVKTICQAAIAALTFKDVACNKASGEVGHDAVKEACRRCRSDGKRQRYRT